MRVAAVTVLAVPSLAVIIMALFEVAELEPPGWLLRYDVVLLLGGAALSFLTVPAAIVITWTARGKVSPRTQWALWWICAAALLAPALALLQVAALSDLS